MDRIVIKEDNSNIVIREVGRQVNNGLNVNPLPSGGLTGQVLTKLSDDDNNVSWQNITNEGSNVNFKTSGGQQLINRSFFDRVIIYDTPNLNNINLNNNLINYFFTFTAKYPLSVRDIDIMFTVSFSSTPDIYLTDLPVIYTIDNNEDGSANYNCGFYITKKNGFTLNEDEEERFEIQIFIYLGDTMID